MSKKYPNLIEAGLKVGDTVDGIHGEMIVVEIVNNYHYPIKCKKESDVYTFTACGFDYENNHRPSIWFKSDTDWFNPPMSPPEPDHMKEFYTDRPVWVRDNDEKWRPRYAALYMPAAEYKFRAFSHGKRQSDSDGWTGFTQVSYTKPEGAEDHENA